jgi:hypothetical protein
MGREKREIKKLENKKWLKKESYDIKLKEPEAYQSYFT